MGELNFPEIIDTGESIVYGRVRRPLRKYELNWSRMDQLKKERRIKWIETFSDEVKALNDTHKEIYYNQVLPNADWNSFLGVPEKYSNIFDVVKFIYIPDNYIKELNHYEKLANEEWTRGRGLDTCANDECLDVSKKCVDTFFYILSDVIRMYNRENINVDISEDSNGLFDGHVIECIFKFKFWSHQTGGGLVVNNAFSRCDLAILSSEYIRGLRIDLERHWKKDIPGLSLRNMVGGVDNSLKTTITKHYRDSTISDILK
jgi:hypothetical protein